MNPSMGEIVLGVYWGFVLGILTGKIVGHINDEPKDHGNLQDRDDAVTDSDHFPS